MTVERFEAYRRLLRWYPPEWRARNEAIVVAILLDQADARGETKPSMVDRFTLAIGGIRHRFGVPTGRHGSVILPLAIVSVFFVYYLSVIAWSPGARFHGTIGPFANPSIIVGVLFVIALGLAVSGRDTAARTVALVGVGVELCIALLAAILDWLGPSLLTVVLVAGLGVVAALPWRGIFTTLVSLASLAGVLAILISGQVATSALPGLEVGITVVQAIVLCGASVVLAVGVRRATKLEKRTRST